MPETLIRHETDQSSGERMTLDECLELLRYEQVDVRASAADPEYLAELGLDDLPAGIAIVGGAARAILLRSRYGEKVPIRDIDLIEVEELSDGEFDRDALSAEFMPDDYTYGHGMGSTTIDSYFATRDLTINEVLVVNGMVLSSRQADEDIRDRTIRACDYEVDERGRIGPKLKLKAELLCAVFDAQYGHSNNETPEAWAYRDFYTALAVNKAFQYGREVTELFMERLGYEGSSDELYQAAIDGAIEYATDDPSFSFNGSAIAEEIMAYVDGDTEQANPDDDDITRAVELLYGYRKHLERGLKDEY